MRFVVDENLPDALADWLSERKHDVAHVRHWLGGGADDAHIWSRALAEQRIVVTKDNDFRVRRSAAEGPQVLLLSVGNRDNADLLRDIERGWAEAEARLTAQAPVVVIYRSDGTPSGVRANGGS